MYNEYFGFKEAPFNLTPNPRFMFYGRKYRDAFSSFMYGIEHRKGFIQITGEIGAGKTTLCRVALELLKGKPVHSALILNPCLSELLLLRTIAEDFGIKIKAKNKKDCFDAMNQFLLAEFNKGYNCVLIIDEAQDLDARALEQIRLLSNLETHTDKLLQIILVGQPELRDMLNQQSLTQLRQRIHVRVHLTALDRNETEEYIENRLQVASLDGQPKHLFTADALDLVYAQSQGIPRLINKMCDWALLAAYAKSFEIIDRKIMVDAIEEVEGVTLS